MQRQIREKRAQQRHICIRIRKVPFIELGVARREAVAIHRPAHHFIANGVDMRPLLDARHAAVGRWNAHDHRCGQHHQSTALALALPKLLTLAAHADDVLTTTQTLATAVGDFVEETRPMLEDVSRLVANANGLIADNTEAVADAVEKLNNIDIERLNEAIDGLASAVQPLARLGDLFSR